MRFKRGDFSMYLGFILLLTMFFSCTIAFLINNKVQQERGSLIDYMNQRAMVLQSDVDGYSKNPDFCFMYENGTRVSQDRAEELKNSAIDRFESDVRGFMDGASKKVNTLYLNDSTDSPVSGNPIQADVREANLGDAKDVAVLDIYVYYYATFRAPYVTENATDKLSSSKGMKIELKEHVTRAVENPRRYKNTI